MSDPTAANPDAAATPLTPPSAYLPPAAPSQPTQPPYAQPQYGAVPPSPYAPYAPYGTPPAHYSAPQAPYGAPYGYGEPKTNSLAIIAMISSIVGTVFAFWILPIVCLLAGAIMGHISLSQIKASREKGRGMALAAVIIGWTVLGVILLIVVGMLALGIFVVNQGWSPTPNPTI